MQRGILGEIEKPLIYHSVRASVRLVKATVSLILVEQSTQATAFLKRTGNGPIYCGELLYECLLVSMTPPGNGRILFIDTHLGSQGANSYFIYKYVIMLFVFSTAHSLTHRPNSLTPRVVQINQSQSHMLLFSSPWTYRSHVVLYFKGCSNDNHFCAKIKIKEKS